MILKNYQQALAITSSTANASLVHMLLKNKILGLRSGLLIPDSFIAEIERFTLRNSIVENKSALIPCPRCLKAHAIKTAEEMKLDEYSLKFIFNLFKGETGHDGYYLDSENLVKI